MRRLKVQYFNQYEEEQSGEGSAKNDFVNRFTSTLAGGTTGAPDDSKLRGTDGANDDNIFQSILKHPEQDSPNCESKKISKDNLKVNKVASQNPGNINLNNKNGSPKQQKQNMGVPVRM